MQRHATIHGTRSARQLARDYSTARMLERCYPDRSQHYHDLANEIWEEARRRDDRTCKQFRQLIRTDRRP